jgi:hypothetical protein
MFLTDDSLLPENQEKLIICAAPYGRNGCPATIPKTFAGKR